MQPAVRVQNVSKWFGKNKNRVNALSNIHLTVPSASIFALVGPNGSGKTTLLKILSTLLLPNEGEVWVNGFSLKTEAHRIRHTISFVGAEGRNFYWRLTARQNLEFFAALCNLSKNEARKKIQEITEIFGLGAFADRPYEELSTGVRQRLALARSFLNEARVLLADEPTRSLDPLAKSELKQTLRGLSRQWNKTILFTTHDLHEAEELANTIGILHESRLVKTGSPAELAQAAGKENLEAVVVSLCQTEVSSLHVP